MKDLNRGASKANSPYRAILSMTQKGKCDICRQRKVKCDEQRPVCGQCQKKNRPCQFGSARSKFLNARADRTASTSPKPAIPISEKKGESSGANRQRRTEAGAEPFELTIRSIQAAEQGQGIFHTFSTNSSVQDVWRGKARRRENTPGRNIPQTLVSPEISLNAQFIEVLSPHTSNWNPSFLWGLWVAVVPLRLGRNPALDDATACFIAAILVLRNRTEESTAAAGRAYNQALLSLQSVLHSHGGLRFSTETLAAVKFLLLFEKLLAYRDMRWIPHCRGLIQLIVARGPQVQPDDMSRSLFYASLVYDFMGALLGNRMSVFDSPEWLQFPPPENSAIGHIHLCRVSESTVTHMIQLPRLVSLVRQVRQTHCEVEVGVEALALAERLYSSSLTSAIDIAMTEYGEWVLSLDEKLAQYYRTSFEYVDASVFESVVRYCAVRILLLGLCRALGEIFPFSPAFDAVALNEEELRCASLIAASVQYAETQTQPFPIGTLIMALPLQVAFGTWWRRHRSEPWSHEDGDWELDRAIFMQEYCLEKRNSMIGMCNGDALSAGKLQMWVEGMEGGPWDDVMRESFTTVEDAVF